MLRAGPRDSAPQQGQKGELADEDLADCNDAAMRVNASRWAAMPAIAPAPGLAVVTQPGQPGETCVLLVEARGEGHHRRSYEIVSLDSLTTQRQAGDAGALGPFQRWPDTGWKRMSVAAR